MVMGHRTCKLQHQFVMDARYTFEAVNGDADFDHVRISQLIPREGTPWPRKAQHNFKVKTWAPQGALGVASLWVRGTKATVRSSKAIAKRRR